ncbi:DUF1963 domain-containing protein [Micrococcus sp.]|uniref:DUF1963 domain-containing protein n=1 Tax=Micrococcus sp. TaxID=1271 RepID=UPI002A918222|nr:DUF1963 domain-containing protein [Micrococcus sp.]MDY6055355.1 DUF1963 domain-containing protein [Micrococcus sp.]
MEFFMAGSVPIHGARSAAVAWLAESGVDPAVFTPQQIPVFSENSFSAGRDELDDLWSTGAHINWLGGPAVSIGAWPRNAAGVAMAHVATFHLSDAHAALGDPKERGWPDEAAESLPDHGYIQVFHDLETYGYEPDDMEARGWQVTWHMDDTSQARPPLVECENANAPDSTAQLGLFYPGWTIPSPLDLGGLTEGAFAAADAAIHELDSAWVAQRCLEQRAPHPIPSTRLLGHSSTGNVGPREEILPAALPLSSRGDDYVLLAEIESWTTLNGWFGDASSLEVWMRRDDLRERRFSECWCIIRTD